MRIFTLIALSLFLAGILKCRAAKSRHWSGPAVFYWNDNPPSFRSGHAVLSLHSKIYLFGGYGPSGRWDEAYNIIIIIILITSRRISQWSLSARSFEYAVDRDQQRNLSFSPADPSVRSRICLVPRYHLRFRRNRSFANSFDYRRQSWRNRYL